MDTAVQPEVAAGKSAPPISDVSAGVGLAGLIGLFLWIAFCRNYPVFADALGLSGPLAPERGVLSGPYAALASILFTAGPMALWSILVDRVHLRPSTGIYWQFTRPIEDVLPISAVKIIGLWATFAILAGLYGLGRWYWDGSYVFAMQVLTAAIVPLALLCVPYIIWIDRVMIEARDSLWHFGALITGSDGWGGDEVKKHWRAWIIKGFFGAFMISILPPGFAFIVEADVGAIIGNPVQLAMLLITLLFVIDVQIGTVGYLFTLRPLDAHIRSANPLLGGWIAALLCYPPFVWGLIGSSNQVLSYERNVAGWGDWLAGSEPMLWAWAAWLVFLTAMYAWATVAFGIRFSNLTYRGVLTNGPYRYTRHPAYLSKNLFWWCSVMPFLVTSGDVADAVRNSFFLLLVNAIYYWRARTEEAHLLAEDAKYREYYDWMQSNGLITARLSAAGRWMVRRVDRRGKSVPSGSAEPAE